MKVEKIVKWLEQEIEKLPTNYDEVFDNATIDSGIRKCIEYGERKGFERLYEVIKGKKYTERGERK